MGILDKIFRKKTEVQAGEQTEQTVSQPVHVDDRPLPVVNDLVMPKNLHSATRMIVDKHGDVFLEQKAFINMLNDYQLLRESPVIRNVLRNLQSGGYISKLRTCSNWSLDSRSIGMQFVRDFGVKEDIVYYVIKCIGYGLRHVEDVPVMPGMDIKIDTDENTNTSGSQDRYRQEEPKTQGKEEKVEVTVPSTVEYALPSSSMFSSVSACAAFGYGAFASSNAALPTIIGKDEEGNYVTSDLSEMSNLLISGLSGTGKSTAIHIILSSLMMKKKPDDLKFVIIDTNSVEYSKYSLLRHYYMAAESVMVNDECVVSDSDKAFARLSAVVREIDDRYSKLSSSGARSIVEYNQKNKMPYLIVVIDDFGALMQERSKLMEQYFSTICGRGRIVGVHVIAATQYSTRNVLTTTIRSLFVSRLSFRLMNVADSRLMLNTGLASKLQNKRDCILLLGNSLKQLQTIDFTTSDQDLLFSYIQTQPKDKLYELPIDPDQSITTNNDLSKGLLDPMFEEAARFVMSSGIGSTSMIQRRYAIGYNRTSRLMDQLEKAGIVGPAMGTQPRTVLIKYEYELQNILRNLK